jgi:hypothetical protein
VQTNGLNKYPQFLILSSAPSFSTSWCTVDLWSEFDFVWVDGLERFDTVIDFSISCSLREPTYMSLGYLLKLKLEAGHVHTELQQIAGRRMFRNL